MSHLQQILSDVIASNTDYLFGHGVWKAHISDSIDRFSSVFEGIITVVEQRYDLYSEYVILVEAGFASDSQGRDVDAPAVISEWCHA